MSINVNVPKILHYNISDTTIKFTNDKPVELTYTKLSFQLNQVCYIGLQKVITDEETKLTFIDEDISYIPLNSNITKEINKVYLAKNELYTELLGSNITYNKITDKNIYSLFINPYYDYPLKTIVEFTNKSDMIPYKFDSINLPNQTLYRTKIIVTRNNEIIHDDDYNMELLVQYDIPMHLVVSKKTETIQIKLINLSNMTNLQFTNLGLS